ncbi:hypothetical protein [Burkholderia phage FLC9]|nr:hypothetical protein [Burkholderia phage FLC9]
MFMIRMWIRSSYHPDPLYLVEAAETEFPTQFDTRWALPGNKVLTYTKEESAKRAFDQLVNKKPFLQFYQWDDSDAVMEGSDYKGRKLLVSSYEIQLFELGVGRIPGRLSGPA